MKQFSKSLSIMELSDKLTINHIDSIDSSHGHTLIKLLTSPVIP